MSANGQSTEAISEIREGFIRLRGRLFVAVEAVGLPDRQEAAFKSLIRQTTYSAQADLEAIIRGKGH